ncbi:MAG: hypothetical protein ACLFQV_01680 [Vulcanimicrobiota bacterium]
MKSRVIKYGFTFGAIAFGFGFILLVLNKIKREKIKEKNQHHQNLALETILLKEDINEENLIFTGKDKKLEKYLKENYEFIKATQALFTEITGPSEIIIKNETIQLRTMFLTMDDPYFKPEYARAVFEHLVFTGDTLKEHQI